MPLAKFMHRLADDTPSVVREGEGVLHQQRNSFTDDELISTHPEQMSVPMLQAAQIRINEDEDFATRYRAGTVYPPMQKMGINF